MRRHSLGYGSRSHSPWHTLPYLTQFMTCKGSSSTEVLTGNRLFTRSITCGQRHTDTGTRHVMVKLLYQIQLFTLNVT